MGEQLYEVKVQAEGEVRDADGNLIGASPVHFQTRLMTAEEVRALTGQDPPEVPTTHNLLEE